MANPNCPHVPAICNTGCGGAPDCSFEDLSAAICECLENLTVDIGNIAIDEIDVTASGLTSVTRCTVDCEPIDILFCKDENHAGGQGVDTDDGVFALEVLGWVDSAGVFTPGAPTVPLQSCTNCAAATVDTVCMLAPAAPFEIDNGVSADCDINSGDHVAGDPWTFIWTPSATVDGEFCFAPATADASGVFTITGVLVADPGGSGDLVVDWGAAGVSGVDGLLNLPGHFIVDGVCYPINAELCSGGDESWTITGHMVPTSVDKTHGPGIAAIYTDCETGAPVDTTGWVPCGNGAAGSNVDGLDASNTCSTCAPVADVHTDCGDPQCAKWSSVVVQLDNTGTLFSEAIDFEITNTDGSVDTFTVGPVAGWSDQVTAIAAAMDAIYAGTYDPRCTTGCGGLLPPPTDAPAQPGIFARYINGVHCPTDLKIPVRATATRESGRVVTLPLYAIATPEKRGWLCVECCAGEKPTLLDDCILPVPPADLPVCTFSCAEAIPEPPVPVCTFEFIDGNWCDIEFASDPDEDDITHASGILIQVTTCGPDQTIAYFEIVDGALESYDPIGEIVDCDTLLPPTAEPPACPEGTEFECVTLPGSKYGILDNSNWVGAPAVHLQNGNAYEITFTHEDGNTTVLPVLTDPYYTGFKAAVEATLPGCKVVYVCANHTSPKGCNAGHVANLAAYPAYDPPSAPGDIQNNIANPDVSELWASGWLLDCAGCESPIVNAAITASSDPAWVGANRDIIGYENEPTTLFRSTGCDVYWRDCDGNAVEAPAGACCATPCDPAADILASVLTECCPDGEVVTYTNSDNTTDLDISVNPTTIKIGVSGSEDDATAVVNTIEACLAAGGSVDITWQVIDGDGNPAGTGSGVITGQADSFGSGQFSGPGTFMWDDGAQVGKLHSLTAQCHQGECENALRTVGCNDDRRDDLLEIIATNTARPESAVALPEVCALVDGTPATVVPVVSVADGAVTTTLYVDALGRPVAGAITDAPCGACDGLNACPAFDIGPAAFTTGGAPVTFPHQACNPPEDFAVPISFGAAPAVCLTAADPATQILVRWNFTHQIDASTGHTGFNVGGYTGAAATGTVVATSNGLGASGPHVGPNVTPHPDVTADYWVDIAIPLGDILAGVALQTSAFGTISGECETVIAQSIELSPDDVNLADICDCGSCC